MRINLAIVDDKNVNRKTVIQKLIGYDEIEIMLEAGNGSDFLEQLKNTSVNHHPHVVLMDIDMPVLDGIETVKIASIAYPNIKFIMLTIFEDTDRIFEAIKAGANGYLLKEDKAVNIVDAILNVIEHNGIPMSPSIARKAMEMLVNQSKPDSKAELNTNLGLSSREIDILKNLANGDTYNQIGEKLFISPLTVRKHVANLYAKLHVNNRMQIINIARENKLI
ncbi:MAG: response regulator transcription factor [Bacteroidetes bacterium]|nr:response regulator transcription factor [Bacteroidota bacterium]